MQSGEETDMGGLSGWVEEQLVFSVRGLCVRVCVCACVCACVCVCTFFSR